MVHEQTTPGAASGFVLIAVLILVLPMAVGLACLTLEMPSRDRRLLEDIARERALLAAESGMDEAVFEANRKNLPSGVPLTRGLGNGSTYTVKPSFQGDDRVDNDGDGQVDEADEDVFRLTVVGKFRDVQRKFTVHVSRDGKSGQYLVFHGWSELTRG